MVSQQVLGMDDSIEKEPQKFFLRRVLDCLRTGDSVQALPDSVLLEIALSDPLWGSGGDGELTGVFVGHHHQGTAGTLVRDDLETAIGAIR